MVELELLELLERDRETFHLDLDRPFSWHWTVKGILGLLADIRRVEGTIGISCPGFLFFSRRQSRLSNPRPASFSEKKIPFPCPYEVRNILKPTLDEGG